MQTAQQSSATPEALNPKKIWIEIKRRKLLVAAMMIVGVAITTLYTSSLPILYRSTASLLIENFVPSAKEIFNPYSDLGISPDVIKANRILAESRPVLETARRNAQAIMKESPETPDVDYSANTEGQLLYLQVLDTNPARATVYANAWSDAFIEEMKKRAMEPVILINKQFDDLVPKLREDYQNKLKKLQEFEEKNHFNSREYEVNLDNQKLKRLDAEESKLRLELNSLKYQQTWLRSLTAITYEDIKVITEAKTDPDLGKAKAEYERCRVSLREARERFREGTKEGDAELSPKKESLQEASKDLEKAVQKFLENFNKQIENGEKSYSDVKKDLDEATIAKQALFSNSHQWNILNTDAEQAKKLYDERFTQKDNTDLSSKTVFTYARPWERASEPKHPWLPSWRRNLFAGVFFTSLMTILCVIGLDKLDDTIRTPRDFQHKPGLVSMGVIPASETALSDEDAYVLVRNRAFSMISESLRNLHISLEVKYGTQRDSQPLIITVTSAMANEGKSLISSNLALLFAGLGRKVLIMDADLRKRSLSTALGYGDKPGLRDLLNGAQWSPSMLLKTDTPGLFILPAGTAATSSIDSIQPEGFSRILGQVRPGFDIIIFDTPPVLPMADACIMGQASDVTLLVVRSRRTSLHQLESAASNLSSAKVKEIVCVVNGVDTADASSDSYVYGYGHAYGYGLEHETGRDAAPRTLSAQARSHEKVRE